MTVIECWTVLLVTLETRIRSDSSWHAVHVTEVAIERYLPRKIVVHLCMLTLLLYCMARVVGIEPLQVNT